MNKMEYHKWWESIGAIERYRLMAKYNCFSVTDKWIRRTWNKEKI